MTTEKFYSLDNILSHNAVYNITYGERLNGKNTAILKYIIEYYINNKLYNKLTRVKGKHTYYIVPLDWLTSITNNRYNAVCYQSKRWRLCYYEE